MRKVIIIVVFYLVTMFIASCSMQSSTIIATEKAIKTSNKCYWIAYENYLEYGGELVWGKYPNGQHAWLEADGKLIDGYFTYDGIPVNYITAARTSNPDLWLWACSQWDLGLGVGVDSNGIWVSENGTVMEVAE